jgi:NADPH-dependent glutamate synthase beta subunit-like oxidoreductase/CO/xanthine dehydrogenase FAD-binding subunit
MKPFIHHTAQSIGEATRLLVKYKGKAKVNAGGTDLLGVMKNRIAVEYPEAVIDLKNIKGLDYIVEDESGIRIGALARLADVLKSPTVKKEYKLLADAVYSVASPHVRNMATIGGNLAQEVRCWYYRYPRHVGGPIVCLRKGGKICAALAGDNRYHSLFGAAPMEQRPCSSHCPANADIPAYMSKVRKGDFAEAAGILVERNPLAAVTGRVCPVFCESECNRREFDESVAIQCVERGVGDYMLENKAAYFVAPGKKTGKKVAIVGSGPAGLSAAYYLRKSGNEVTVYERMAEAGGMLRYSIPPFRLAKDVVKKFVDALSGMGIKFELGTDVSGAKAVSDLRKKYDAVLLAQGTWRSLKLGVPGESAEGVHYALDYLAKINKGEKVALGRRVVVVGGGSVAMDAARTARRLGASEVHVVCLECRDPNSKDNMLALEEEIIQAEEEGIVIHPFLGVQTILVSGGKVSGVDTVACLSVREPDGSFKPQYDRTCTALNLQADSIIVSIGQAAESQAASQGDAEGVFRCGDVASGPSTVIQAVASAREAAKAIESLLSGGAGAAKEEKRPLSLADSSLDLAPRVQSRIRPASQRTNGIDLEDIPGLTRKEIEAEAHRCFNCGCLAVGPSDIAIALVALNANIVTTKRSIKAERFFAATATCSTVLESGELIKEIRVPKVPAGARQRYDKFTLRKPIDFAVVSVASVLTVKDGVCKDARVVLGAVAPAPLRAGRTEELLKGRVIDEKTASAAARAAVDGAVPLTANDYKAEIVKALTKRAILNE